jgi:hypothetical protein
VLWGKEFFTLRTLSVAERRVYTDRLGINMHSRGILALKDGIGLGAAEIFLDLGLVPKVSW